MLRAPVHILLGFDAHRQVGPFSPVTGPQVAVHQWCISVHKSEHFFRARHPQGCAPKGATVIQVKGELGIVQRELSGKDNNNNGPGEKQLVVRMELHLLWCC